MISTISVHQPPPSPAQRMMMGRHGPVPHPLRRVLNLQYLDLTDCTSLEDSGLKMVVENCPQLIYLFLRRCTAITGKFEARLNQVIFCGHHLSERRCQVLEINVNGLISVWNLAGCGSRAGVAGLLIFLGSVTGLGLVQRRHV
jgi:hypothetical protein